MALTASNTVHFNGDTFIIVKLTPEPHFIHITHVLCLDDCKDVRKMVSEAIRYFLALSFLKLEHNGWIHIISGLSGQVLTIGQCPRPGGSSLTITMTCDTLNCSRNVSWDQLEQFKSILKLPWRTRPPRPSLQKGNSIAQPSISSLLARDLGLNRTANIKLPPPSVRSRAPHTKSLMILEKKLNIRSKLVIIGSILVYLG